MDRCAFNDPEAARMWAKERAALIRKNTPLRAPAATVAACEPTSPRAGRRRRAGWGWLVRAARRLDDHWIGDLIGAVCLFALLWMGLVIAMVFE